MARERSNDVTFSSSVNYCELAIESADNLYIARYWKNGDRDLAHNCLKVSAFPPSPLATRLLSAMLMLESDIRTYMARTDAVDIREYWWKIKESVKVY